MSRSREEVLALEESARMRSAARAAQEALILKLAQDEAFEGGKEGVARQARCGIDRVTQVMRKAGLVTMASYGASSFRARAVTAARRRRGAR